MARRANPGEARGVTCDKCGADDWRSKRRGHKYSWTCRVCHSARSAAKYKADRVERDNATQAWRALHPERYTAGKLHRAARARAVDRGLEYSLSISAIEMWLKNQPACPIFGTVFPLGPHGNGVCPESPTLDRLQPEKGYVPGNVALISHRANTIKSIGTAAEHERIAQWMRANGLD